MQRIRMDKNIKNLNLKSTETNSMIHYLNIGIVQTSNQKRKDGAKNATRQFSQIAEPHGATLK